MTDVLISGAAGFIGFALADVLSKRDDTSVFVVDNFIRGVCDEEYKKLCARDSVTSFSLDLTDRNQLQQLPPKVDVIYHMAALNGTQNFYDRPYDVARCTTLPTFHLLDHYGPGGHLKRFIFAGSSEAYAETVSTFDWPVPTAEDVPLCISDTNNPRWSYGASKLHGEVTVIAACKQLDVDYTIARYHNVYGPRMGDKHVIPDFLERMNRGIYELYGHSDTRSFIYIEDAVRATLLLAECDEAANETVNVGSNLEVSILDIGRQLLNLAGINADIELHDSPKGSVPRRAPNTTKLHELTGFQEKWTLSDGLLQTMKFYLDRL